MYNVEWVLEIRYVGVLGLRVTFFGKTWSLIALSSKGFIESHRG